MLNSSSQKLEYFRAFLGIMPSLEIQKKIGAQIRLLARRKMFDNVRWIKDSNLHLTLAFLGNLSSAQVSPLMNGLRLTLKNISPLTSQLSTLMAFPSELNPRILSMKMIPVEPLNHLTEIIKPVLESLQIPVESRPFVPHLTIGKIKCALILKNLDQYPVKPIDIPIDKITLFKSELSSEGSSYTKVGSIELGS